MKEYWIDLPCLEIVHLGVNLFYKSKQTIIESKWEWRGRWEIDLPSLQEILLQINALTGSEEEDCSLIMRSMKLINKGWWIDLPSLRRLHSQGFGFVNPRHVVFESKKLIELIRWRYSKLEGMCIRWLYHWWYNDCKGFTECKECYYS